jgi:hypothetical protein
MAENPPLSEFDLGRIEFAYGSSFQPSSFQETSSFPLLTTFPLVLLGNSEP